MIFLAPIFAWLKLSALPWLVSLPRWVWYTVVGVLAFLYVLHWYGGKVKQEQELLVQRATNKEVQRQAVVYETEVERAKRLAAENERKLNVTKGELENALEELAKFKSTADVCLPSTFTDKLRGRALRRTRP